MLYRQFDSMVVILTPIPFEEGGFFNKEEQREKKKKEKAKPQNYDLVRFSTELKNITCESACHAVSTVDILNNGNPVLRSVHYMYK